MNRRRFNTIVRKEWAETIRNSTITGTFALMLVIFTVMPLAFAFGLPLIDAEAITNDPDTAALTELLAATYPDFADQDPLVQFQVFMLRQLLPLFLLLPIMGAMSIATYSIIGEKTTRSLEALLATPIRTDELLFAKSVAAALPPVIATWLAFAFIAGVIRLLGGATLFGLVLDAPTWGLMLLGTPLVALLGLGLGVIVSSRVNDPRSAQQLGGLLILPIIALIVSQASGIFLLSLPLVIVGALLLALIDLGVMALGISLFNRETILTRWK